MHHTRLRNMSLLRIVPLVVLLLCMTKQITSARINKSSNIAESVAKRVVIDEAKIKSYSLLSSKEITKELKILQEKYPSLASLSTSQRSYNLPTAGTKNDCSFDNDTTGCYNYFLTIEDTIKHPKGSDSYRSLPEVFLSGALHGNERVGPTAVVETARLLLEAASCEALPSVIHTQDIDINTEKGATWLFEVEQAQNCRADLLSKGISDHERKWLARLVSTRRIVILPTANAVGYDRNDRTEMGIDPNRDFPFDVVKEGECMQTIAGRTINEIFRDHMFQISLTFHGGMEVVSYEWGAPTYDHKLSPDDLAQVEIGDGYARFAGDFDGTKQYDSGTMNALVYPVRGGMEDWAYAGSWDPDRVIQCNPDPKLHGEYPREKTIYNNSTLRAFNMLIETSNRKEPHSGLGTSENVLNYKHSFTSNGHVTRNVRLSLMAIDIVQPYVSIMSVNGLPLSDDVVPMIHLDEVDYRTSKIVSVPFGSKSVTVTWTVSGAFTVDSTKLYFASGNNLPLTVDGYDSTQVLQGVTKWNKISNANDVFTSFKATLDISKFEAGENVAIIAAATVDQGWMTQPNDHVAPQLPPMSHVVNARTNSYWQHESAGKIIQGQTEWYSIPIMISINENSDKVVELTNRFVIPDKQYDMPTAQSYDDDSSSTSLIVVIALSMAVTFTMYKVMNKFMRKYNGTIKISRSVDEDNDFSFDDEIQLREIS